MQPKQFNMLALSAVISLIAAGVVHSSYNSWTDDTVDWPAPLPDDSRLSGDATGHILIQQGEAKLTLKKSDRTARSGPWSSAMAIRSMPRRCANWWSSSARRS